MILVHAPAEHLALLIDRTYRCRAKTETVALTEV